MKRRPFYYLLWVQILLFVFASPVISSAQKPEHKLIAGTKCSIIPPAGFVVATSFSGFQNNERGASIMVTEMPAPIQAVSEGFTEANLKAKGMHLIEKQGIDLNKTKATFFKVSQFANGSNYLKQILVFGDDEKTILVNGVYPETQKEIEADIKKALLSTTYNEDQKVDPLGSVNFKIDVGNTGFKLAKNLAGSLIFTRDGQIPSDKPMLIAGNSLSKVAIQDKKQFSIDRLKKLPGGELMAVKEIKNIVIDQLEGFEIVATGKNKNAKDEIFYQVMLFDKSGEYYMVVGNAKEDFEDNLVAFKSIAKTFRRK